MPLVKAVFVPITVKGADEAKLKIGQVNVAAEKLKELNPTITPKIESARALMEARLLRAGINAELSKAGQDAGGRGGILGGVLGWLRGGSGFGGVKTGAAGGTGILGTIGGGLGGLLGAGPAGLGVIGGITVAVTLLLHAIGGIVPAIAAAGIGVAAFGALARPTITAITTGVTAISGAATKVARDKAWDAIPKALQPAVGGALGLQKQFSQLSDQLQPLVLKIVSVALRIGHDLLPMILPFAQAAGKAIDGLLKGFDRFVNSKGFAQFLAQMQMLAGPTISVIGNGIGKIVISIGKLLQQMATPQGLYTLQLILGGIARLIGFIGLGFEAFGKFAPAATAAILSFASSAIGAFRRVSDVALFVAGIIIRGFALAFGWLPGGIGKALRGAAAQLDEFRGKIDKAVSGAQDSLRRWSTAVLNAPKIFKLQADITNLQDRLAAARALLADKRLTATKRARIEGNIDDLQAKIALAKQLLASLQNKTIFIQTVFQGGQAGHPTPPHAAAGGWAAGWTMVGEMGRELVALPHGSYVYPHAQTERIMAGGGNTYHITVNVPPGANMAEAGRQMTNAIRAFEKGSGKSWRTP